MKAIFRFRYLIHCVLYAIGFTPWDRIFHFGNGFTTWLVLTEYSAAHHWLSFQNATIALLIFGLFCAFAGASIRTWGSAYLGASIVQDHAMHGSRVMADGPYRFLRNPLYLGTWLHTFALALLMPASGAVIAIITITAMQLVLIAGEEKFLAAKLGQPYLDYKARVPRLLPALTPRIPASGAKPAWPLAFISEIYFWGVFLTFAVLGWRYNSLLLTKGVIISLGVSLIIRALLPKASSAEPAANA
jgi:protein-S-isoprenylcysteine O-methyltransferase Ste14